MSESWIVVRISGVDCRGLIASITGTLFDQGANLLESGFHSVKGRFEFHAVAAFPLDIAESDVSDALSSVEALSGADIYIAPWSDVTDGAGVTVTHRVIIDGGDRPGLVARLSEILSDSGADIIQMRSEQRDGDAGRRHMTLFDLSLDTKQATSLENALVNTAGSLNLKLSFIAV